MGKRTQIGYQDHEPFIAALERASGRIAFVQADTGKEISDGLDLTVAPAAVLQGIRIVAGGQLDRKTAP